MNYSFVSSEEGVNFAHLLPPNWKDSVNLWLHEDIPSFDIGGFVVGEKEENADLFIKSKGLVAGIPFATAVLEKVECQINWLVKDGEYVDLPSGVDRIKIASVTGKCRNILLGERTALNILARCSGIATEAKQSVDVAKECGWHHGMIAGTRKTTPGFRLVEKYGLLVGGADTHRYDLSQMVMLKDNHIWSCGSITNAVRKAKGVAGFSTKIEVECRNVEEGIEAATAGADIIMLDNYSPTELKLDAEKIKKQFPAIIIEASGGITNETIADYFSPFVDIISRGSLTQGYGFVDFSLKIVKK